VRGLKYAIRDEENVRLAQDNCRRLPEALFRLRGDVAKGGSACPTVTAKEKPRIGTTLRKCLKLERILDYSSYVTMRASVASWSAQEPYRLCKDIVLCRRALYRERIS
jgi:hypothetical protein